MSLVSTVIAWTLSLRRGRQSSLLVSSLDLTLETDIVDDVMWPLMDGKHIVSVPHHDGLCVHRVDDGLDEEIDGMAADFAMRLKRTLWLPWTRQRGK